MLEKMWDSNNYTINKKRPNSRIEGISVIKKQYHQHSSVANALNNHFCDVASDVATFLLKFNRLFKSYLTLSIRRSFVSVNYLVKFRCFYY